MALRSSLARPAMDMAPLALPPDAAPAPKPVPAAPRAVSKPRTPAREGKKAVAVWVDPAVWRQLRWLSADKMRSMQDLGEEALDLLFHKHGLHRMAWKGEAAGEASDG
jgi:hypothetical protein